MRGLASIDQLCAAAREDGADALALTDTNALYGAVRFVHAARREGLKPIVGAELVCGSDRAVVLAKTAIGYENLCALLSARHSDPAFDLITAVRGRRAGLILVSDDPAALAAWQRDSREDLYVEATPGSGLSDAFTLCRDTGLPALATNRAHLISDKDFPAHRLLRAIALRSTPSRIGAAHCCAPSHTFCRPEWIMERLACLPSAVANTRAVADACAGDVLPDGSRQPDTEDTVTAHAAYETLRQKAYAGAIRRYGSLPPGVLLRLEEELRVIRHHRLARYFLIVEEIVRRASRTSGRGSAAASIVSYCLGITHVDPIRQELMFERFLTPARHEPPDIDVDVPWDERGRLIEWALAAHGPSRAAMVGTHCLLGFQGAFREIARAYGLSSRELGRVAPLVARHAAVMELGENPRARAMAERLRREIERHPPCA
jgi:error-prone DNA polymerase